MADSSRVREDRQAALVRAIVATIRRMDGRSYSFRSAAIGSTVVAR